MMLELLPYLGILKASEVIALYASCQAIQGK